MRKSSTDHAPTYTDHSTMLYRPAPTYILPAKRTRFPRSCVDFGGKIRRENDKQISAGPVKSTHFDLGRQTSKMPPKKEKSNPRTPRIRAFKHLPPQPKQPPDEDEDEDDEEDPLKEPSPTVPTRTIITANVAAARKREAKKQVKDQPDASSSAESSQPAQPSNAAKDKVSKKTTKSKSTADTSSDKKTKSKPTSAKGVKDKQIPSTSGEAKTTSTKSKAPKVRMPKTAAKSQTPPASKSKSGTVTKSGKPATSKKSVGTQPHPEDSENETPAPEEEADYFASSDEDPRDAQIQMDEAMARALEEDAEDSPIDLDWSKRKWTPSEDEAIIDHVRSHKIYYNMKRTDFKERSTKDEIWKPLERRFKVPGKHDFKLLPND